jgi:hypothetical protein
MNNIQKPNLRIQRPKLRPISRTNTPVATPVATPVYIFSNTNKIYKVNKNSNKSTQIGNITTTEAPRSRSTTMTLENFETSNPSSRPSSRGSSFSLFTPVTTPPRTPIASVATVSNQYDFTGINSSRNLNKPPNYNPNFKVPKNNNKTRKNKQIINSYGPNFKKVKRNIFHYNNNEVSNQKFLPIYQNYVQTKKQSNQNKVNKIQNWTKPTKRKWYDPRTWGKTRKLRR